MIIFSTYFKIIKSNIMSIGIYITVFLVMVFTMGSSMDQTTTAQFTEKKVSVYVWNQDEDSELTKGLTEYIKEKADYVALEEDLEYISDALFFRQIEYAVIIPCDFTKNFLAGTPIPLEKMEIEGSYSSVYMDQLLNGYLESFALNYQDGEKPSLKEVRVSVQENLSQEIETRLETIQEQKDKVQMMGTYFNFTGYAIMGALISAVAIGMSSFDNREIHKRNRCGPIQNARIYGEVVLANLALMMIIYGISLVPPIGMFKKEMLTGQGLLMALNLLLLNICSTLIGSIISMIVKSQGTQDLVTTSVALGLAFISGMFVPQNQLSDFILKIGSFTPSFWYVQANDHLVNTQIFSFMELKNVWIAMAIQLGFSVMILSMILAISRQNELGNDSQTGIL